MQFVDSTLTVILKRLFDLGFMRKITLIWEGKGISYFCFPMFNLDAKNPILRYQTTDNRPSACATFWKPSSATKRFPLRRGIGYPTRVQLRKVQIPQTISFSSNREIFGLIIHAPKIIRASFFVPQLLQPFAARSVSSRKNSLFAPSDPHRNPFQSPFHRP